MTLHQQKFQGTPGANITAAASAGGGSTAYSLVNPASSAAITFSDAVPNPCHGGTVGRFDGTLGTAAEVRWTPPGTLAASQSVVVMFTGKPADGGGVLDFLWNRGTIINATGRLMEAADGRARLYRRGSSFSGGDLASAAVTALLDQWAVIDLGTLIGSTAANGGLRWRIRALDDLSTPLVQVDVGNVDTGLAASHVMNLFQLGKTSSSSGNVAPFYIADHRLDDTTSAFLPDPTLYEAADPQGVFYSPDGSTLLPGTLHYSPDGTTLLPVTIA